MCHASPSAHVLPRNDSRWRRFLLVAPEATSSSAGDWYEDVSATHNASAQASETNVAFDPVGILSKRWGSQAEWERHATASMAERLLGQRSALIP